MEVEVAVGGTGNDVFVGGGRSSVFVRADDGDDIVIGGAANDALFTDERYLNDINVLATGRQRPYR